jgi:hypothetical protein
MKMIKIWSATVVLSAAVAFAGCITAEDTPDSPSVSQRNSELSGGAAQQHCVVSSNAQPIGGTAGPAGSVAPARCFATFQEAIFAATNGRVQLPSSVSREAMDDRMLNGNALIQNASFVIGIEFVDSNFQGATLTITNSVTCIGFTHTIASMPAGWNDVVSSAKAFSNCNHSVHFENSNFGGASIDCGAGCGFIGGALNDRTSSIRWNQ